MEDNPNNKEIRREVKEICDPEKFFSGKILGVESLLNRAEFDHVYDYNKKVLKNTRHINS